MAVREIFNFFIMFVKINNFLILKKNIFYILKNFFYFFKKNLKIK